MKEIVLERDLRLRLRAQAHHLDPVVLLGANGLTDAVIKEIDRELTAHELIKVRVPSDDREEREAIYAEVAEKLGCARVQMIGKLLVLWRPSEALEKKAEEEDARFAELVAAKGSVAGRRAAPAAKRTPKKGVAPTPKKKVASKKPGEKKKKKEEAPRRARPKSKRITKKAAMS